MKRTILVFLLLYTAAFLGFAGGDAVITGHFSYERGIPGIRDANDPYVFVAFFMEPEMYTPFWKYRDLEFQTTHGVTVNLSPSELPYGVYITIEGGIANAIESPTGTTIYRFYGGTMTIHTYEISNEHPEDIEKLKEIVPLGEDLTVEFIIKLNDLYNPMYGVMEIEALYYPDLEGITINNGM